MVNSVCNGWHREWWAGCAREYSLQWRHNGRDIVSNHQPHHCLLNRLFRHISKKTSKLRVTGLCAGNSPVTDGFPAQMASYVENVSIWWRHHVFLFLFNDRNNTTWKTGRKWSLSVCRSVFLPSLSVAFSFSLFSRRRCICICICICIGICVCICRKNICWSKLLELAQGFTNMDQ